MVRGRSLMCLRLERILFKRVGLNLVMLRLRWQ
ncbi:hypothetical protein Ahy_B03g066196 isoform B [Arachis hypogaea]|uniref:Uncharacterized protein n=1 Tax=Arachis hypogaea TaxID=3818 RepID=A0A445A3F0_ARAHY|nr:hypothetical protein Ahy_B03g066196 isoform B [Arachis hypogaea]